MSVNFSCDTCKYRLPKVDCNCQAKNDCCSLQQRVLGKYSRSCAEELINRGLSSENKMSEFFSRESRKRPDILLTETGRLQTQLSVNF